MPEWTELAARLADKLTAAGKLSSPEWQAAVRAVPRHVLVPFSYRRNDDGWVREANETPDRWPVVYSNIALFTQIDGHDMLVSSSSEPSLMTRMLELLDVHDGHRVLEIGTGSGYNVALLAHRLGDDRVYSIDVDAELVGDARGRLAGIGYQPTLVVADGEHGLAEHAPFDRIIATCSVPRIPLAWIDQLADDGLILVDLKLNISAGNLVLLRRTGDRKAVGRFDSGYAAFMAMRHEGAGAIAKQPAAGEGEARSRVTGCGPVPWEEPVLWFLAQFDLPPGVTYGFRFDPDTHKPAASMLSANDGSWVRVDLIERDEGGYGVVAAGPTDLWRPVEEADAVWRQLDRPVWSQFGLTVDHELQRVWFNSPDSSYSWPLPRN